MFVRVVRAPSSPVSEYGAGPGHFPRERGKPVVFVSGCFGDRCGSFALKVYEDLSRLGRGDGASALEAFEHDTVQSATELNVALACRAAPGEDCCLFHISVSVCGLILRLGCWSELLIKKPRFWTGA